MKIHSQDFREKPGEQIKLSNVTSTKDAPWHVVPADDKKNARLIVSEIILDALESLKMSYPKTTDERREELKAIRKEL
jgi:precorrin-2 methylase